MGFYQHLWPLLHSQTIIIMVMHSNNNNIDTYSSDSGIANTDTKVMTSTRNSSFILALTPLNEECSEVTTTAASDLYKYSCLCLQLEWSEVTC